MSPEETRQKIEAIEAEIKNLKAASTIPKEVDAAFRGRFDIDSLLDQQELEAILPTGLLGAPLGAITAPTGGATIDSQARTAINSLITRLEDLGLIDLN